MRPALPRRSACAALLFALSACGRDAAPVQASNPADAPPAGVRPQAGAASPGAARDTVPASGALPPRLAACAVPDGDAAAWSEVGRTAWRADTLVLVEKEGSGLVVGDPAPEWAATLLHLSGGACHVHSLAGPHEPAPDDVPPPGDPVWEVLLDHSFAWHVRQAGSVQALAGAYRARLNRPLAECHAEHDDSSCFPAWVAERFRRAGVAVAAPS